MHGDEFVALGATAADCEKLERPHCVLNSFLPANWSRHQDMETHWGARYSFLSRLLASGLDVFMMDSDFAVHRNVWHWLDASPCAARASCGFFAEGGGPNGGTAWVRAAAHTGNNSRACTWLLAQPARRYVLFLEAAGGGFGPPGNLADQSAQAARPTCYTCIAC